MLISLFFAQKVYYLADPVGIVITFFIARIGYEILKDASDILVDTVCIDTSAIKLVVSRIEGVQGCHDIRTGGSVNSAYVDLHVLVRSDLPIGKAHEIAEEVFKAYEMELNSIEEDISKTRVF